MSGQNTQRVEFRLSMPGVASWDSKWSGEGKNYVIVRQPSPENIRKLGLPQSWSYAWTDGWRAQVSARLMAPGERAKKSDGFCGYDWMVDNIQRWGRIECHCDWKPSKEGWERCVNCQTERRVAEVSQ